MDVVQHIWLADLSKSSRRKLNDLWLVSQSEMFILGGILYKDRWEKRSDIHTKDNRIRKEISPRIKASPAKATLSEKFNKILHKPNTSIVCFSNTTKATISLYIHILYILLLHHCVSVNDRWLLTIFTNPSARAGYDTRSIFKRSLTGLNSEFSFS